MKLHTTLTLLAASTLLLLSGCDAVDTNKVNDTIAAITADKSIAATDIPVATPLVSGELTTIEHEQMAYMREEEKLARDVYRTLYNTWGLELFANITNSEQRHTDRMQDFLLAYGISDPVLDDTTRVFTNPDLAQLYNDLITQGMSSELEAIKVGLAIEEIDMVDIRHAIEGTDKLDIQNLYENLLRGSRNHLRAFVRGLEALGETYTATYISQEEADLILSSGIETGTGSTITPPLDTTQPVIDVTDPALNGENCVNIDTTQALSAEEAALLSYMREEEKLARDVYQTLHQTWGNRVFDNISVSEQRHTEVMMQFHNAYGLADPVTDDAIGSFTDPHLAQLYTDLVTQGLVSEEAAIRVGIAIEEIDMVDLQDAINATSNEALKTAYNNLMEGSKNHLRAFVANLNRLGFEYQAQYITQEEADAIINNTL